MCVSVRVCVSHACVSVHACSYCIIIIYITEHTSVMLVTSLVSAGKTLIRFDVVHIEALSMLSSVTSL